MDQDDGFSTFITIAIVMFSVFFLIVGCVACCAFYNRRNRQAIYSTPVVVTSQSFQPPQGTYPVTLQTSAGNNSMAQSNYQPNVNVQHNIQMPMPMPPPSYQQVAGYQQQEIHQQQPGSYQQQPANYDHQPAFNPGFKS